MLSIFRKINWLIRLPKTRLRSLIAIALFSCLLIVTSQISSQAAKRIKFNFGLLGFNIELQDLDFFAQTGQIPPNLKFYLHRISPKKRAQLQSFLKQTYKIQPWVAYRFAHTSVGERLLDRMGDFVQIPQDINGFYGIRAAILKTVTSPESNNLLNLLKNFPTDIKLDLPEIIDLLQRINSTERAGQNLITALAKQTSNKQNLTNNWDNLGVLGTFSVKQQTITFYDESRDRTLVSDFYLPQTTESQIPLIVISNGLGAQRTRFNELGNYLASYGFAVLIPEHPGSDYQRQREFIQGLHQENFAAGDYLERPKDISFLLDRLSTTQGDTSKQLDNIDTSQLDTSNVGVFGYSIGGTTALSLAGAKLDFVQLANDCNQTLDLTNISRLYQCRALEINTQKYEPDQLADRRIKAVYLFVPFGKSLFSPQSLQQIETPILWQVVDRDFLTSLSKEQVPLYNNLQNSDRYFVLSENLPHSTAILSEERSAKQQRQANTGRKYQNILSLIFFNRYIGSNSKYNNYLSQQFLAEIIDPDYKLYLTKELPKSNE